MHVRKAAELRGEKTYFTGRPCPRGHIAPRSIYNATCVRCERIAKTEWQRKQRLTNLSKAVGSATT